MKAIIPDGSQANDKTGKRVRAALTAQLQTQGRDVEQIALCEQKIGNCAGDFFCWIRTPGMCNVNDDNHLYVGALPAPMIETLERIAARWQGRETRRQLFAAIANCGFPEAHQCVTAQAICETFARQAEYTWAGALALGAGQMINGGPLMEGGGKNNLMRHSLDMAAAALSKGKAIPKAARDSLAKPLIPHWLYWLMAAYSWLLQAKHYRAVRLLWRQPYPTRIQ